MKDRFGNPVELVVPEGPGGFVEGTLVHTREGPRPVETIKPGDAVLAKLRGGGGEPQFKRVVRTQAHEERDIFFLTHDILEGGKYLGSEHLVAAGGQRLWVARQIDEDPPEAEDVFAWLSVFELWEQAHFRIRHESRMEMRPEVERRDGRIAGLGFRDPIMLTATPDVGITFGASEYWYSDGPEGVAVRFSASGPHVEWSKSPLRSYQAMYIGLDESPYEHLDENDIVHRSAGFHPMRRKVFELEVEDGYGYYAGPLGLLVGGTAPA